MKMTLRRSSNIIESSVRNRHRSVGTIRNLYFDHQRWAVRFFLVNTGNWFIYKPALMSCAHLNLNPNTLDLSTDLSEEQIKIGILPEKETSPTRKFDTRYGINEGAYSWNYRNIWGSGIFPRDLASRLLTKYFPNFSLKRTAEDLDLCSANEVNGYSIDTLDGKIGWVRDLLIDPRTWSIRYLDIETVKWDSGEHVLLSPDWISSVDSKERSFKVELSTEGVREYCLPPN